MTVHTKYDSYKDDNNDGGCRNRSECKTFRLHSLNYYLEKQYRQILECITGHKKKINDLK